MQYATAGIDFPRIDLSRFRVYRRRLAAGYILDYWPAMPMLLEISGCHEWKPIAPLLVVKLNQVPIDFAYATIVRLLEVIIETWLKLNP